MNRFESIARPLMWFMALLLAALAAGCGGGGQSPILGGGAPAALTAATYVNLIKPRVDKTDPATTIPGPTVGAPINGAITATFTKDMAPATIIAVNFTVVSAGPTTPGAVLPTSVIYDVGSRTAIFTHAAPLTVGDVYTATITSAATDLTGNALAGNQAALPAASNYVWTFTATAAVLAVPVTVASTNPVTVVPAAAGVCPNASINATFTTSGLRMDPATINPTNFTVTGPGVTPVTPASVLLDSATGKIATFTPSTALTSGVTYTATIKSGATGVKDLAIPANPMALDYTWTFVAGPATGNCLAPIALGKASTFGIMATSAITNTGAATMINGDVSLEPGTSNGLLPVQVNGTIHINDTVSHQARIDLLTSYNSAKALPPGTTIPAGSDLGAFIPTGGVAGTLPPGTYTSGSTMLISTPLTLDAGGNVNAVWVFQIGSSLTTNVGAPGGNVILANGAQAKNVFWVPTASATIGVGTTFYGTIIAGVSATGQTGAIINGRILAGAIGAGTIALDTNTVNVPAP